MLLRNKAVHSHYAPHQRTKVLRRSASASQLEAPTGAERVTKPPRVASAPARLSDMNRSAPAELQGLDRMAAAGGGDLVDAAYSAPATPAQQLGGDTAMGALGPNALSMRGPSSSGAPHIGADFDRGGVTLHEEHTATPGEMSIAGTHNLGGSMVGGSIDAPLGTPDHHGKLGVSAVTNGQTVGLTPSVAFHDMAKDELGLGFAVFGTAHSAVRVIPEALGDGVAIESRHACSKGFGVDPRIAWAPVWAGAFFKMVQSQVDETLFRLTVTQRRAGKLLARQRPDGLTAFMQNWFRQWSQVTRNQPSIRQPDINDPLGDAGGRRMRPGQTLLRLRSQTRVWGAGAGVMGMRAGRYNLHNQETQVTVRCLDDFHVVLVISPRTAQASSNNVDSPLGPNLQEVNSQVEGALKEHVFNLREPAQKAMYQRLVRGDELLEAGATTAAKPQVSETATLIGRDEARGVVRVPFDTTWGGFGEHMSRHEMLVTRDESGRLSQSREVVAQTTQHALEQGKNAWRIHAQARASSVSAPNAPSVLAFRGLRISAERSATRPDLAMRNVINDEHARLWRKEIPMVTDSPRDDYKVVATTVFSGRQLSALEHAMPGRAAAMARATGAAPETLVALIGTLCQADGDAPLASPFARAWRRSALVGDYVQATGAAGLAALHRLLGGPVHVSTSSSVYEAPLQALRELNYLPTPGRRQAQKIADRLRGALRAAHADAILRTYHGEQWLDLVAKLERGLADASHIAAT